MHPRAAEFAERARSEYGFDPDVEEFPEGTKTAADAAAAIGCDGARSRVRSRSTATAPSSWP